jgi:RNA polymerase sigma factor (sigma-70 family)
MSTSEFNHLVLQNADILRPFALSLTRDSEQAKDLYQETLCKAFSNRDKYSIGTNIKAWLYTIMRNIFINDYRRRSKRRTVSTDFQETGSSNISQAYSYNNAASNIVFKDIRKKINILPDIFKHPFNLYYEGYKYHEIANAMNEPLGTIKSRIHFARKLLKEQLERN